MDNLAFPLLGEPLAVDLANTVVAAGPRTVDLLAHDGGVPAWCAAQAPRLPAGPVRPGPLRDLRDAVRELLQATVQGREPDADAVARVDAAAAAVPLSPGLVWDGRALRAVDRPRAADAEREALAAIARSAIAVVTGHAERLRTCDGPGCVLLFVATNPRRRWCAPHLCGNRVRVARHQRRRRRQAAAG